MQEQPHSKQRKSALGRGDGRCKGPEVGSTGAIQELGEGHVVCVILRCGRSKKFEFYFFNKIKCIVVCVVKGL